MKSAATVAKRLLEMSSDEIQTRLGQALRKRSDEWLSRFSRNPLHVEKSAHHTGRPARFFFDPKTATALAHEIGKRLPQEAASIVEGARRIQRSRFDLLGYAELAFGDQPVPDWHLDPVHGIRAPHQVWFRVPYLNSKAVGDHKIIWELNRHQHLSLLARAFLLTRDLSFLNSLKILWRDWRKNNLYPFGINWASTLEVGFRALSWIWVDHLIDTAGASPDEFRMELTQAIGEHAVYIERYLSTYFAPNTHLLGEALALFFIGVLYPQFERASRWRDHGWQMILREASQQIRADGFHFEQSVYYHVYALDMFLWARILAAKNAMAITAEFDQVIERMAEGLAALGSRGLAPRFGDDDGGRLFDGRRNRSNHMLDPLATASVLYRRADWNSLAGEPREETIWLLGMEGLQISDGMANVPLRFDSRAFPDSGYYVIQSGKGEAVIDAGPHGWRNGGHGHADALSLQLIANGQIWLTDPGTYSYSTEGYDRNRFRGTGSHNTMEVDGNSQADPIHSFAWGAHPQISVTLWHVSSDWVLFRAEHQGYRRLSKPVTHERWVIRFKDGAWWVRDRADGEGSHRLDLRWHFGPECELSKEPSGYVAVTEKGLMRLTYPEDAAWDVSLESYEYSPVYGSKVSCPVVGFAYEGLVPAENSLLITLDRSAPTLHRVQATNANVVYLRIEQTGESIVAFSGSGGAWSTGRLKSDAQCLILEYEHGRLVRLLSVGASEIEIDNLHFSIPARSTSVFEWHVGDGIAPLFPATSVSAILRDLKPEARFRL